MYANACTRSPKKSDHLFLLELADLKLMTVTMAVNSETAGYFSGRGDLPIDTVRTLQSGHSVTSSKLCCRFCKLGAEWSLDTL